MKKCWMKLNKSPSESIEEEAIVAYNEQTILTNFFIQIIIINMYLDWN